MSNRAVSSGDRSGHGHNTKWEYEQPGSGPGSVTQAGGTRGGITARRAPKIVAGTGGPATRSPGQGITQKRLAGVPEKRLPTRTVPLRAAAGSVAGAERGDSSPKIPFHHPETPRYQFGCLTFRIARFSD